jgi:hypothetical protein
MHIRTIERATAKLQCGGKLGTAFLISPQIMLTALHNLDDYFFDGQEIILEFLNISTEKIIKKATPLTGSEVGVDVVALKLEEEVDINITPLKLVNSQIPYNIDWQTFGYPAEIPLGVRLEGKVITVNENFNPYNWNVDLCSTLTIEDYSGLSGAPLIIDETVKGILIYQQSHIIGAISIDRFTDLLDSIEIDYENSLSTNDLPGGLEERAYNSIPNYKVFELIENTIEEKKEGYLIVTGTPGAGKTIVAATFIPVSDNIEIIGRYFIRVPDDQYSVTYRASNIVFAKWLELQFARILYGSLPEEKDYDYHTYVKRVSSGLNDLSSFLIKDGKIGVIFVDGVDDAFRVGGQEINKLLGLLPRELPKNIIIVLIAKPELLPAEILQNVSPQHRINLLPLPMDACRAFINKSLKHLNLTYEQLNIIAEKTSGHPLYMNYLVKFLIDKEQSFIEEYITNLPVFSGEIEAYYETIWNDVCSNEHGLWILSTICRLRSEIDKPSLIQMLPQQTALSFPSIFDKIKHLINDVEIISIFHYSFAEYLSTKTEYINSSIHDKIGEFCRNNLNHIYSLRNIIYHLIRGSDNDLFILACNQEWADQCSLSFIEPDIVVSDIKEALYKTMEKGNLTETVRLLLLLQRIGFRNNNILGKFATEIARLLISLNLPDKALSFILRESMLVISNEDALYFLNALYDKGAIEEGNILYEAIKARYVYMYENNQITIDVLDLQVQATLMYDLHNGYDCSYIKSTYDYINELLIDNDFPQREKVFNRFIAFQFGYILWKFGRYASVKELVAQGAHLSKEISEVLALSILTYEQYELLHWKYRDRINIIELINDLERLISEYGIDNKLLAAFALFENSKNFQLVEKQILEAEFTKELTSLRKKNGVDINWNKLRKWSDECKLKGYLKKDSYKISSERNNWESYLISIIKYISYSFGKACRLRAECQDDELNKMANDVLTNVLEALSFKLAERISWDRSYSIPEAVVPMIYEELIAFILQFNAEKSSEIIQFIQKNSDDQLGLYTEGYRKVLFNLSEVLLKSKDHYRKAFSILKQLEEHIEIGVLNRWERSECFLKLAELYGVLGNKDKARAVYYKMLETSMGPSWYKEDQLSIMTDLLDILSNKLVNEKHFNKIAGLLQASDGEMTFQRFIRYEKENLIGCMCKFGQYNLAFKYFRELTFPSLKSLISRAESFKIDSPTPGEGFVNGTHEVNEQGAILNILDHCNNIDPLFKLAITEIFFLGDSRYNNRFIEFQAKILNSMILTKKEDYDIAISRLVRLLICDFDQNLQMEYLSLISEHLNQESYQAISREIERSGFSLPNLNMEKPTTRTIKNINENKDQKDDDQKERMFFPGIFGTKKSLRESDHLLEQAKSELEIENFDGANNLLINALKITQQGGWDIWGDGPSENARECYNLLSNYNNNEKELLYRLAPLIIEEVYAENWRIVVKLIKLSERFLTTEQAECCLNEAIKHTELLVRPTLETYNQYKWLNIDIMDESLDHLIIDFVIWLTYFPNKLTQDKSIEVLKWLTIVRTEKVVPSIVKASLEEGIGDSAEIAAGILHSLSIEKINCWKYIRAYQDKIITLSSFQIKAIYYEITNLLSDFNEEVKIFNQQLKQSLFSKKIEVKNIDALPVYMSPINRILKALQNTQVANSEVFERTMENLIQFCEGLSYDEIKAADKYLKRSYGGNRQNKNLLSTVLKQAFDRSLKNYVIEEEYQKIIKALRSYNPFFPDADLSIDEIDNVYKAILDLFNGETQSAERCSNYKGKVYLHYFELVYNQNTEKTDLFEILSYFVNRRAFKENPFLKIQYEHFDSNSVPDMNLGFDLSAFSLPAVVKVSPSNIVYGGNLTPAFPHAYLFYLGYKQEDFNRRSWRIGRILTHERFGMPEREGCSLMVRKSLLDIVHPDYKLVRLIKYNEKYILLDPEDKLVIPW